MLLLVLVLVLIAFGLLVVALLTASVLWAWVSVGVSVAAAGVLLVDWLQRRSAGRAGDDAAIGARAAEPSAAGAAAPGQVEGATEYLPVVPPPERPADPPLGTGPSAETARAHPEPGQDLSRTVVMPVVTPSGSAGRPPGAAPPDAPSPGSSSRSVTGTDPTRGPEVPAGAVSDVEDPAAPPPTAEPGSGSVEPAERSGAPRTAVDAPAGADQDHDHDRDHDRGHDPAYDHDAAPGESTAPDATADPGPAPSDAGAGRGSPSDADRTGSVPGGSGRAATAGAFAGIGAAGRADDRADDRAAGSTTADARQPADAAVADEPAADELAADEPAADEPTAHEPPVEDPTADSAAAAFDPVEAPAGTPPPADLEGDLPEESTDARVAGLVAELEDEVVVVDERPRYHVTGCRSLTGSSLIPLPVREAVELGFTPCGWCTPARTLADRNPARAH